ncbi:hypothetical protein [Rhodopila globiformis]|uniref:hypothetical protein n=1 Tax=Rhodopila globiformis TaxID=1071 RepID=UPI0011B02D64|nr:hypothetical protein [Rhodopila globiformis]
MLVADKLVVLESKGPTVNLHFEWQAPVTLAQNKKIVVKIDDLDNIEDVPGVYYFARNFGEKSEPFYIGQTLNLRSRVKSHLETRRIADILRGMTLPGAPTINNGGRSFHFAFFR